MLIIPVIVPLTEDVEQVEVSFFNSPGGCLKLLRNQRYTFLE
jgi:hypothetical protein